MVLGAVGTAHFLREIQIGVAGSLRRAAVRRGPLSRRGPAVAVECRRRGPLRQPPHHDAIGSVAADYLMAFGILAIRPTVVQAYALPLLIMIVFGTVYSIGVLWLLGRRAYHNFWFERSLFVYGWNTGVIGTGVASCGSSTPGCERARSKLRPGLRADRRHRRVAHGILAASGRLGNHHSPRTDFDRGGHSVHGAFSRADWLVPGFADRAAGGRAIIEAK